MLVRGQDHLKKKLRESQFNDESNIKLISVASKIPEERILDFIRGIVILTEDEMYKINLFT